ncbi:MAG: NAD(P)/FAD-dependent oxidoreductase [Candidatus Dormibacteraceae bacterium]
MDTQVAVIGAGPVGSALALLLRRHGVDTVLLEKAEFPRDKPCGEAMLPAGAAVLRAAGVDLRELGYPRLLGTRFRMPGRGWVRGAFGGPAYGVRRLRLDAHLAALAGARTGTPVSGLRRRQQAWVAATPAGEVSARFLVACDGLRSPLRRQLGWDGPNPNGRFGLVGHLQATAHGLHEIVITLLGDRETYLAPAGEDELLLAVLGAGGTLRHPGRSVEASYLAARDLAHPELCGAPLLGRVHGAGPFDTSARRVAGDGAFLCGDAAGFLDPLTGDGMSAGLLQAACLAELLAGWPERAEASYRAHLRTQWRHRRWVRLLATRLAGSPCLAERALRGAGRRPVAIDRLLLASYGPYGLGSLRPRDWMALAGW